MDVLQARHVKERKELQAKITSKKKNATKKTRKGVNDECDRLEQELKENQHAEIATLAPPNLDDETSKLSINDEIATNDTIDTGDTGSGQDMRSEHDTNSRDSSVRSQSAGPRKPNRQKARLARRVAEQQAQAEAAADEAAKMPDRREQEMSAMKSQMEQRGLIETMIRPDGHCLYSACVQTIPSLEKKTYKDVRIATADYMKAHTDDFAPFLEEPIDLYTHKIRNTAEWGGHLELQAISKAFNININVLQASGQVEEIRPEQPSEKVVWLAYYRHSFGLGEHYNALRKAMPG